MDFFYLFTMTFFTSFIFFIIFTEYPRRYAVFGPVLVRNMALHQKSRRQKLLLQLLPAAYDPVISAVPRGGRI